MAKESLEKNRSDDLKTMMKRAEHREVELNLMIDTLEARNGKANLTGVEIKLLFHFLSVLCTLVLCVSLWRL